MSEATEPSDAELMRRAGAGEREAFAELYARHQATVYRFARLMTASETVAEDVVQDVFLAVMREGSRWDAARSSLTTYLFGIARHHTRRRWLRERRFTVLDITCERAHGRAADASDELAHHESLARLRGALVRLPSRYREVIVLCDLQGVSYTDAAAAVGCAVGTVRSRLHRGRRMLAERLTRAGACRTALPAAAMRCET